MKLIESLKGLFQIGKGKTMSEETTQDIKPTIDTSKKGNVITVSLTQQEKTILQSLSKSSFFNEIVVYLNQLILDGTIYDNDVNKIDDFINDWRSEHVDEQMPKPMQFLEVIFLKITDPSQESSVLQTNTSTNNIKPQSIPQQPDIIFDDENLPSYLPKIHDIIEREVRRRVRVEMRDYAKLKIEHNELISKMADISKLFSPK